MKKITAILLSLCMILSFSTASVFAAEPAVQEGPEQTYYQFIEKILDGFDFDKYLETLEAYVDDLNSYIAGNTDLIKNAKHLIADYIEDATLDDESKVFLKGLESVIVAITTDPDVNENGFALVSQVKDFVTYLDKNKNNLKDGAVQAAIQSQIKDMASTINKALDAIVPYTTKEAQEKFEAVQTKLETVKTAFQRGTTVEKIQAVVTLVADKGFQQIATNTVKTVVKQAQTRVVNFLNNFFRRR